MEKGQVNYVIGIGGWEHEAFDECFYPHGGLTSGGEAFLLCRLL